MTITVGSKTGSDPSGSINSASDRDLVRRVRAGERAAEVAFYTRYRRQVAATLFRVMGSDRDLEDLVQDVFVIAFRGLERFRGDARLSTWLYRICVNVALGRIRTKGRRPKLVLSAEPLLVGGQELRDNRTPAGNLESKQDRARVYAILDQMAPKKRIVLFLHEIEGLDPREIAAVVDAHPVTVRTRLFYARREFFRLAREAFAGDHDGGEQ